MKIFFVGDIVGKPGRDILTQKLPAFKAEQAIDVVIANGENAAGGSGMTVSNFRDILRSGVDVVTLGDHAFKQKEILPVLDSDPRIIRPGNYPAKAPGRGWTVCQATSGVPVAVISLQGRVFMQPVDCPFAAADRMLAEMAAERSEVKIIVVDFHAEATSDMQLLGRYLDGRVSAVLGTHTHVATADEQILPGGTAFQCDVGMCGPFNSIIGRRVDRVLETVTTFRPTAFDVARGDTRINGTLVDVNPETGKAEAIKRVTITDP